MLGEDRAVRTYFCAQLTNAKYCIPTPVVMLDPGTAKEHRAGIGKTGMRVALCSAESPRPRMKLEKVVFLKPFARTLSPNPQE